MSRLSSTYFQFVQTFLAASVSLWIYSCKILWKCCDISHQIEISWKYCMYWKDKNSISILFFITSFIGIMLCHMPLQMNGLFTGVVTFITGKGFLSGVWKHVILQVTWLPARIAALLTPDRLISWMSEHICVWQQLWMHCYTVCNQMVYLLNELACAF